MLLKIPKLLTSAEVAECRALLDKADWTDGRATAGDLAIKVKNNTQLPPASPPARRLRKLILERLAQNGLFKSAALPHRISLPMFNRYQAGQFYGSHIDAAIRHVDGEPPVRTDLSATVFLNDIDEYDGGELVIEDAFGPRGVKLAAGDMVLYPGTSVHHVTQITRGLRLASFFWVQSLVRADGDRMMLLRLDAAVKQLKQGGPQNLTTALQLTNVYHNLLRRWADT